MRYKTSEKRRLSSSLFTLFLIFLLFIQSCQKTNVRPQSESSKKESMQELASSYPKYSIYPRWFWKMPHNPNAVFAVGYAQTYFYPDSSVKEATENGIKSLAKSVSVRIKGERGFIDTLHGPQFAGEDFQEVLPEGVLDYVKKNHKVIATETVDDITLVLLCIGDAPSLSSAKSFNSRCPSWISKPPKREGFLYSKGQCTPQYHQEDAWQLAEYDARIDLALSLFAKLRSLVKKLDRNLNTITAVKTDVVLNRVQVIERWLDPKNGIPYVLVRMPLKDNTETSMDYLRKIVPPKPYCKEQLNREEIIQKAFEELDEEIE